MHLACSDRALYGDRLNAVTELIGAAKPVMTPIVAGLPDPPAQMAQAVLPLVREEWTLSGSEVPMPRSYPAHEFIVRISLYPQITRLYTPPRQSLRANWLIKQQNC